MKLVFVENLNWFVLLKAYCSRLRKSFWFWAAL